MRWLVMKFYEGHDVEKKILELYAQELRKYYKRVEVSDSYIYGASLRWDVRTEKDDWYDNAILTMWDPFIDRLELELWLLHGDDRRQKFVEKIRKRLGNRKYIVSIDTR